MKARCQKLLMMKSMRFSHHKSGCCPALITWYNMKVYNMMIITNSIDTWGFQLVKLRVICPPLCTDCPQLLLLLHPSTPLSLNKETPAVHGLAWHDPSRHFLSCQGIRGPQQNNWLITLAVLSIGLLWAHNHEHRSLLSSGATRTVLNDINNYHDLEYTAPTI